MPSEGNGAPVYRCEPTRRRPGHAATARRRSIGCGPQTVQEQAEGELEALVPGAGDELGRMASRQGLPVITERCDSMITRPCACSTPGVRHRAYLRELLELTDSPG